MLSFLLAAQLVQPCLFSKQHTNNQKWPCVVFLGTEALLLPAVPLKDLPLSVRAFVLPLSGAYIWNSLWLNTKSKRSFWRIVKSGNNSNQKEDDLSETSSNRRWRGTKRVVEAAIGRNVKLFWCCTCFGNEIQAFSRGPRHQSAFSCFRVNSAYLQARRRNNVSVWMFQMC